MKNRILAAITLLAVAASIAACGGKKKDVDVKNQASDGKTSATASYDPGNKTPPDSSNAPSP